MEQRNKLWRIVQRNKFYASKMRLFASYGGDYFINNGRLTDPRWIDLYKANWNPVYKSVRTPCSCYICRHERYNRRFVKKETKRIIDESI